MSSGTRPGTAATDQHVRCICLRTQYRIDDYQQTYFVIDSFEDLLRQTLQTDFAPIYRDLSASADMTPDTLLDSDHILQRGRQVYAKGSRRMSSRAAPVRNHRLRS